MNELAGRGRELYRLFRSAEPLENLNQAFCEALGATLGVDELALFESDPSGGNLICRFFPGRDPRELERKIYGPGEGLCGAAFLTREVATDYWADPKAPGGNVGFLRAAIPIEHNGACAWVIEILKRQATRHPEEDDLFLIRTFGTLHAVHAASARQLANAAGSKPPRARRLPSWEDTA